MSKQIIGEENQTRKHKRAIIWYNLPYSMNVKTNIGETFFKLLQMHFPPTHPMCTIFNKNKIKISYSYFCNMGSIISSHNKHILSSNNTEYGCDCNNRDECPLENECVNMLNKRSEFISKCQHINKRLSNRVKDDSDD